MKRWKLKPTDGKGASHRSLPVGCISSYKQCSARWEESEPIEYAENLWKYFFPQKKVLKRSKMLGQRWCFFNIFSIALWKTEETIPFYMLYLQTICFYLFFSWRKKNYKNLQGIRGGGVRFSLWTANILLPFCWAASLIRLCCDQKGIRTGSYLCFWILLDTGSPQLKTPPSISIRNDKDCRGMCCFFFVSIAMYVFGPGHAWQWGEQHR